METVNRILQQKITARLAPRHDEIRGYILSHIYLRHLEVLNAANRLAKCRLYVSERYVSVF